MKRIWLLAFLVAGCGATPPPAPVQTTTTTTATVTTTSPRIDTPRKLAGFDPCRLLEAKDFDEPLYGTPSPNPNVPNSCEYRVGSGTDKDLIVIAAIAGPYEETKGSEVLLNGHSTMTSCTSGSQCTTAIAVSAGETVKITVHLVGSNPDQRAQIAMSRARAVLTRLPQ